MGFMSPYFDSSHPGTFTDKTTLSALGGVRVKDRYNVVQNEFYSAKLYIFLNKCLNLRILERAGNKVLLA